MASQGEDAASGAGGATISVRVKTMDDSSFSLDVSPTIRVSELKTRIAVCTPCTICVSCARAVAFS